MVIIRYVVVVVYVPHLMYTFAVERKTSFLALFSTCAIFCEKSLKDLWHVLTKMRTSAVEVNMADADLILESQPPFVF